MVASRVSRLARAARAGLAVLLIAGLLPAGAAASAPRRAPTAGITLGLIGPFSGQVSGMGQSERAGVTLAVEQQNAAGGLLGQQVMIVEADSQCSGTLAGTAAQTTIANGAQFIIGDICSGAAIAVAQVVNPLHVVQISPTATNFDVTVDPGGATRPYTFRAAAIDPFQGIAAARFARTTLGAQRAFVLADPSEGYSSSQADTFETAARALGMTVQREGYDSGAPDLSSAIAITLGHALAFNADLIYLPDLSGAVNTVVGRARAMGMSAQFLGSDGWTYNSLNPVVTDGSFFTDHFSPTDTRPAAQTFRQQFSTRFSQQPDSIAALSYDSAKLLFQAITTANTVDSEQVKAALEVIQYDGVTGTIFFDAQHNPNKSVVVQKVRDGGIYFAESVAPLAVGLVPEPVGIADGGFNESAYQGLLRAGTELGVTGNVYTPTSTSEYGLKLQECVDAGNSLCVGVGFTMANATLTSANANPATRFAALDVEWGSYPANLRGVAFASDQVGYLAGTLAGHMTASDSVGVVGGMRFPVIELFVDAFDWGARCAKPGVSVAISYTNSFSDPALGAGVAQEMIGNGADVIFAAAGETGNGAVLTATQSGVWAIGVDTDQWLTLFNGGTVAGSERLLTSAMKRFDNALFNTVADVAAGTFSSGAETYGLAAGGVGLAPFHEADPAIPAAARSALERAKRGIMAGMIRTTGACPAYLSLPVILH